LFAFLLKIDQPKENYFSKLYYFYRRKKIKFFSGVCPNRQKKKKVGTAQKPDDRPKLAHENNGPVGVVVKTYASIHSPTITNDKKEHEENLISFNTQDSF
jgi:hypothetical protein